MNKDKGNKHNVWNGIWIAYIMAIFIITIGQAGIASAEVQAINNSMTNNAVDLWKPPMYIFVSNPTSVIWCCDGHNDFEFYTTLSVRITDIHFKNWKGVPVTVSIGDRYEETKMTDSNGEALFMTDIAGHYEYGNAMPINVTAKSPISGRYVRYFRNYIMDMKDST